MRSSSTANFIRNRLASQPARCPGILKVKSSGDPIDIEHFACKVEPRTDQAFHRLKIDLVGVDSPCRHKFLLIGAFAANGKTAVEQLFQQGVYLFMAQVGEQT